MYFQDRKTAAAQLSNSLSRYIDDDIIVATLNDSSDQIGEEIARYLHAPMTNLISRAIRLPGESSNYGSLDQTGHFSYNTSLTKGEIDEYEGEYHNFLDAEKMNKTHEINREITAKGLFSRDEFLDKIVLLVSDGLDETTELDSAIEYLKPIRLKRLVISVPVASVKAVDRMHITCDEIHCLSVTENYLSADHYYDDTREK